MIVRPNCGRKHDSVRGKCPFCSSDFHGHVSRKRAVQPRDLANYRCPHGVLRLRPCPSCERTEEECVGYRRSMLSDLKKYFTLTGVGEADAVERSKRMIAEVEAFEAEQNK